MNLTRKQTVEDDFIVLKFIAAEVYYVIFLDLNLIAKNQFIALVHT